MFADTLIAHAFRRFIAIGAAALVLTLSVLAASPAAHERLHHDCLQDTTHACAVVLFAQGIWSALSSVAIAAPAIVWCEFILLPRPELRLATPRYLRQPERGPPAR